MLVPCDNLPWGPYEVSEECIADKDKQRAYLDQDSKNEFYTLFYHNQETFDAQKHGDEAIKRVLKIIHESINYDLPEELNLWL